MKKKIGLQKDGRSIKGAPFCKRGHPKEFGKDCRECNRLRSLEWQEKNREYANAKALQWHADHRDEHNAKMRAYQKSNRAAATERHRNWKIVNIEHVREYAKKRYHAAPDKSVFRERCRSWEKRNPEQYRALHNEAKNRRRVLILKCEGSHTLAEWKAVQAAQGNRCAWCGVECKLTKDHIQPLRHGGTDYAQNLMGLCAGCNSSKHSATNPETLAERKARRKAAR